MRPYDNVIPVTEDPKSDIEPCDRDYYGIGTPERRQTCEHNFSQGINISLNCYPMGMDPQSKFGYTLFFILVPWPFFIYEFFTSRHYEALVAEGAKIMEEMSRCAGLKSVLRCYLRLILHSLTFFCCVTLWPFAVLFIKYYNDGKYYLAKGAKKVAREKKIETSEVLYSTARVMEVSLESSFQPTIQLYLLFPALIENFNHDKIDIKIFTLCKEGNLPILQADQTISIITSILSLSWCFTSYHATLKRGALDKDLAALFYRWVDQQSTSNLRIRKVFETLGSVETQVVGYYLGFLKVTEEKRAVKCLKGIIFLISGAFSSCPSCSRS